MVSSLLRFIKQDFKKGVRLEVRLKEGIYRTIYDLPEHLFAEQGGQNTYQQYQDMKLLPKLISFFSRDNGNSRPAISLLGYYYAIKDKHLFLTPGVYEGKPNIMEGIFQIEESCIYEMKIITRVQE